MRFFKQSPREACIGSRVCYNQGMKERNEINGDLRDEYLQIQEEEASTFPQDFDPEELWEPISEKDLDQWAEFYYNEQARD